MGIEKKLQYRGSSVFYRVYGSGKPVVLVHGFGEDSDIWKNQVEGPLQTSPKRGGLVSFQKENIKTSESSQVLPLGEDLGGALLKDKFMFIVPDLPGSGQSEMIDDMSMEGMAEVIKVILDSDLPQTPSKGGGLEDSLQEEKINISESPEPPSFGGGLGEVVLIGHSMGGYITLAFAEKYHDRLSAFGLFHSSAFADSEEKKAARRKGIEFIKEHGAYEFLKISTPNLFSPASKSRIPGSIEELVAKGNNFLPEAIISYYEAMIRRPDRSAVLKNAQIPVLFIMGEHDIAAPLQDVLKQCHLPQRSYIHILHHSGHMGMLEETDKANQALKQFLSFPD